MSLTAKNRAGLASCQLKTHWPDSFTINLIAMRLLRSIRKDLIWLWSLHPALKIAGLSIALALMFAAWHAGLEWWTRRRTLVNHGMAREVSFLTDTGVMIAIALTVYVAYVLDRDRGSR